jgi:potassium-transporting ATPase KdpC subunit
VRSAWKPALLQLVLMSALVGLVYPLAMTALAQVLFPWRAQGSLVELDGRIIGSVLIGQRFDEPGYFRSRPSATTPPYDAAASSGSNLGPTNPLLVDSTRTRVKALRDADPDERRPVPVDLVTASASGLDPDITPAAALYQVPRVARVRDLPGAAVEALVEREIQPRQLGVLGEPRVNVLRLNLALDSLAASHGR